MKDKRIALATKRGKYLLAANLDKIISPLCKSNYLVSGFYRSGTTWVQEVVADAIKAKTIFEPLCVENKPPFHEKKQFYPANAYFPYDKNIFSNRDLNYLDNCFKGMCSHRFAYFNRYKVFDSLKTNCVVKVVRGHFILDYLIKRYDLKVIHVSRNPGAVINSLKYAKWPWRFDNIIFKNLYPDLHFLHQYDSAKEFEKIAAFWAYCEYFVPDNDAILKVNYEDLVTDGFDKVFSFINATTQLTDLPSIVTSSGRENLSKKERLYSWKKQLTQLQQDRIEEIVQEVEFCLNNKQISRQEVSKGV